jgi:23S rRNA pseudouridine2605 synthase
LTVAERIRVQKAIAHAGLMSRRAAEEAISRGRVTIGDRQAVLGDRVDVDREQVFIDGAPIPIRPGTETHLLYKPVGVVSTADDDRGRTTVVDLVETSTRLYPVGRLDADSEGLILLSNDGDLTNLVTHPRFGISKRYLVLVAGRFTAADVRRLVAGVELDDGPAKAMAAKVVDGDDATTMVEISMAEGRNREIRRMLDVLGFEVKRLVRTAIGPITDTTLKPGASRRLTPDEVWRLTRSASRTS